VGRLRAVTATANSARAFRRHVRFLLSLRALPRPVAIFYWRAYRHAWRTGDEFSLLSASRPAELAALLALARGRIAVVELGTGSAWSAVALALNDVERRVVSYDPHIREQRQAYLSIGGAGARDRIELRPDSDSAGPRAGDRPVEFLFIDSQHEREPVMTAFAAWQDALAPGAVVAFHDYRHPDFPGVHEAIGDLGLEGREVGGLFVWQRP
jgi:hypothetical protein